MPYHFTIKFFKIDYILAKLIFIFHLPQLRVNY